MAGWKEKEAYQKFRYYIPRINLLSISYALLRAHIAPSFVFSL